MDLEAFDYTKKPYFNCVGGFPPKKSFTRVEDYDGSPKISIWCTQLSYTDHAKDEKNIVKKWLEFLKDKSNCLNAIHFNSKVSQILFDAACQQDELRELRFKWGSYKLLDAIKNLKSIKYLYIGSGASVERIEPLVSLKELEVLFMENFKKITDYSILAELKNLKQLSIFGSIYNTVKIDDIAFIREMSSLESVILKNVRIKTIKDNTIENLHREFPEITFL